MNKDAIRRIVAKGMLLAAVVLLCVPAAAHIWGTYSVLRMKDSSAADPAETAEYAAVIEAAREYNDALPKGVLPRRPTGAEEEAYLALMNFAGTGIMGRISIPKIHVELPIYHGDGDEVLQMGAGHMPGTSLPVESESSHVVLSGHSGLATKPMFTELSELEPGDTFTVTALHETLTYEVDQICTVLPTELDEIIIEPGKEYCTLVTCTPYGVYDHRLLVRGHRIDTGEADAPGTAAGFVKDLFSGKILTPYEHVMLGVAALLFALAFLWPLAKAIRAGVRRRNRFSARR